MMRDRAGQTPVFKGDLYGEMVLGSGLSPNQRNRPPQLIVDDISAQAENIVNKYLLATRSNIGEWRDSKYIEACQILEPGLNWFEKQVVRYPVLNKNTKFRTARDSMLNELVRLGGITGGLNTVFGTAVSKLGSGTFGTVWEVAGDDLPTRAIKIYHPFELEDVEKRRRFERGYRAMKQLSHSNIVKVYEFSNCPLGFTMDFIDGPNLRDFAYPGIDPLKVISMLGTISRSVYHAHSRGVVHRDIKPENIIVKWDGNNIEPYLTDFDLSVVLYSLKDSYKSVDRQCYICLTRAAKQAEISKITRKNH